MRLFWHWRVVAAWWSAVVAPPPVVVSGAGGDRVGAERMANLVDGVDTPVIAAVGAINPSWLPPVLCDGWEGGDQ